MHMGKKGLYGVTKHAGGRGPLRHTVRTRPSTDDSAGSSTGQDRRETNLWTLTDSCIEA